MNMENRKLHNGNETGNIIIVDEQYNTENVEEITDQEDQIMKLKYKKIQGEESRSNEV